MGIDDFGLLAALEKAGSFSGAARALGIAHTTVARRLRQIEDHYQTRLFETADGGLVPTAAGERVLAAGQRVAAEIRALERTVQGEDQRLSGLVRLTTVDVLAWHFMPHISAFRRANPEIDLVVETSTELRSLSRREAEMALRLTNRPDEYLFGRKVGRFDFRPFVHTGHMRADMDIGTLPWIEYGGRDCAGPANRWLRETYPQAQARTQVTTPLMMLRAIEAGLGAGLLPSAIGQSRETLMPLTQSVAFSMEVWLLAPEELRHTARIRAVFDAFG